MDAWYYLFSTVPQIFAAAYALLLGLAIFRLQQIRQAMEGVAREIDTFFARLGFPEKYSSHCAAAAASHDWDLYLACLTTLLSLDPVREAVKADREYLRSKNFLDGRIEELTSQLYFVAGFWNHFRWSLLFTGILIAATTILIPVGYYVNQTIFVLSWIAVSILVVVTVALYLKLAVALLTFRVARAASSRGAQTGAS